MLEPSASRFWQAATQSGLIAPDNLQACWNSVPAEKREPDAIDRRIARQAVQGGFLTLWQAQQLMTGRSTGFKIDRYILLELVGQGGMGRVYLAQDTRLNRKVALKILSPERMNNPRARARFHREAIVGAQLQHEHLVRIYDEGEAAGKCYLVMEFIEGKNIGQMIAESGTISPAVAARLGLQVALGLEHAQRKGLIHRDVNPYNILVTRDGNAKLTDLGLALDLAENDRVTRDGATVGTFDYVSPEQARHSHDVDTRSDIYSLGCTLYHMLTGKVPFSSASLPEKLFGHQALEPDPVESIVPGVPSGLILVLAKMMKKSAADRYPTPFEVAQALGPFADDSTELAEESVLLGGPINNLGARSTDQTVTNYPISGVPTATVYDPELDDHSEPAHTPLPTPVPTPRPEGLAGLGLLVDFGPEPSLSGILSTSKGKSKIRPKVDLTSKAVVSKEAPAKPSSSSKPKAKGKGKSAKPSNRFRRAVPPIVAGLIIAVGAAAFWAYQGWKAKGVPVLAKVEAKPAKGEDAAAQPEKGIEPNMAGVPEGAGIMVVASDGTTNVEPDLATALRSAIGSKGFVLLANKTPLDVPSGALGNIGGGVLAIRAAPGSKPVLRVEIKGRKPFIATRGDTPLRLEGITIEARYTDPDTKADPNPVIDAGSHVTLTRCAFRLEGKEVPANSRGVMTQGGIVSVKGSSFENFGRAFDMTLFAGTTATFTQCLFARTIRPKPLENSPPTTSAPTSSALWVRVSTGGPPKQERRLKFERCTVLDQTFLALRDFAPRTPTKIIVNACAIRVESLLTWGAVALPSTESMDWAGKGNRYDIRGKSWVLLAPKGALESPLPEGPSDLETWKKLVNNQEVDATATSIKFTSEPDALSEHPEPSAFAVLEQVEKTPVGADPKEVGPIQPAPPKP